MMNTPSVRYKPFPAVVDSGKIPCAKYQFPADGIFPLRVIFCGRGGFNSHSIPLSSIESVVPIDSPRRIQRDDAFASGEDSNEGGRVRSVYLHRQGNGPRRRFNQCHRGRVELNGICRHY
jgi:hypothetical protein